MRETQKTLRNYPQIKQMLKGDILDIGCGSCPVTPGCTTFQKQNGDANYITKYIDKQFDVVFSSHCLQHMWNPYRTIKEWFKLVKPGGLLIVTVPDQDLYEQGVFPSRYNRDHKWTFTVNKVWSWSKYSVNLADLARLLEGQIVKMQLQDAKYNYNLRNVDQTVGAAMAQDILIVRKADV